MIQEKEKEKISDVQSCYDLVAEEYARRIYDELQHKPFDRAYWIVLPRAFAVRASRAISGAARDR